MATQECLANPDHLDPPDQPPPLIASIAMTTLQGITQQLKETKERKVTMDCRESQEPPLTSIFTHSRMS